MNRFRHIFVALGAAMVPLMVTAALPAEGAAPAPVQGRAVTDEDRLALAGCGALLAQIRQAGNAEESKAMAAQLIQMTDPLTKSAPDEAAVWMYRGAAALITDNDDQGLEAGANLRRLHAIQSPDPIMTGILGSMSLKHWVVDSAILFNDPKWWLKNAIGMLKEFQVPDSDSPLAARDDDSEFRVAQLYTMLLAAGDEAGFLRMMDMLHPKGVIRDGDQIEFYAKLAEIQVHNGKVDAARETLAKARPSVGKAFAAAHPGTGGITGGFFESADAATPDDGVHFDGDAEYVLGQFVQAEVKIGDIEGARETARQVADPSSRSSVYLQLVQEQAARGDFSGAQESESLITGLMDRQLALASIVEARMKRREYSGLQSLLTQITDHTLGPDVRTETANSYLAAGDFKSADELLAGIEDPDLRVEVLCKKAIAQKQYNDDAGYKASIAAAQELGKSSGGSDSISLAIAMAQAAAGDAEGALMSAKGCSASASKAQVICRLAEERYVSGDAPGGDSYIKRARLFADTLGGKEKPAVMRVIAMSMARCGLNGQIRSWFSETTSRDCRFEILLGTISGLESKKEEGSK